MAGVELNNFTHNFLQMWNAGHKQICFGWASWLWKLIQAVILCYVGTGRGAAAKTRNDGGENLTDLLDDHFASVLEIITKIYQGVFLNIY